MKYWIKLIPYLIASFIVVLLLTALLHKLLPTAEDIKPTAELLIKGL